MSLPFKEHPLRRQSIAELHARTYEPLHAPERISHITVICGERRSGRNASHLFELLQHFGVPLPELSGQHQHYRAVLGDIRMRWERHTEFVTYTFAKRGNFVHPFAYPVLGDLPCEWLDNMPGEVISATSLALESRQMPERTPNELCELFSGHIIIGSEVVGGAARAWSDLHIHDDGFSRILLRDQGLSDNQAGRLAKRVLEVNSYRAMALLGLPPAREANRRLSKADSQLITVATQMSNEEPAGADSEKTLLVNLTGLAVEIETVAALTSYRFEASRAYYGVMSQRLEQLRQRRIEGLQTFSEFLEARLAPAIATCDSTAKRQRDLAERAARLTSLLRARVEVELQRQNGILLDSMNKRAKIQLRLQETVEGLSVIAIGYYGVGLVGYLLKGLEARGFPLDATYGTGLSAPIIVIVAWLGLRRMKARLLRSEESKE